MRYVFAAIKCLVILLFIANLFYGLMAHASGHHIPAKTNISILGFSIFLIIVFIVITYLARRNNQSRGIN